jgi:hypothetical protein
LGVAVSGIYVYVADGEAGLRVVDVSDPAHPVEIGFYDSGEFFQAVAISGSYVYVADGVVGLRVVDVSDPAHPVEVGFYNTPGGAEGVAVSGADAYVVYADAGLHVVTVSDPAHPVEIGFYDSPGAASDVAVSGEYVYVADGQGGLLILRHDEPVLIIDYPAGQSGSYFTFQGTHLPTDSPATVMVNGNVLGTVPTDSLGNVSFLLNTEQADVGYYNVTVTAAEVSAVVQFVLDPDEELHLQEGSGTIFAVPEGIAYTDLVYLPFVSK